MIHRELRDYASDYSFSPLHFSNRPRKEEKRKEKKKYREGDVEITWRVIYLFIYSNVKIGGSGGWIVSLCWRRVSGQMGMARIPVASPSLVDYRAFNRVSFDTFLRAFISLLRDKRRGE